MKSKKKLKYLILGFFLLSFCIVLFVSYWANEQIRYSLYTMEYNIERRLDVVVDWLAESVSVEELDQFRNVEDMELPSYNALRQMLHEFSVRTGVLYAYYLRQEGDYLYYIIDNDFDETTRVGLDSAPFFLDDEPWIKTAIEGSTVHAGLGNYAVGWDGLLTSYAPVFRPDGTVGAIAGIDMVDVSIVTAMQMVRILTVLQLFMVCAVFASGLFCFSHLRKETIAAEDASLSKSNFIATISHEIRTPLNAVIGLSDIVLNRGKLTPESESDIQQIHHSGTSLLGIINDILDNSKIEAGSFELVPVEYESASLINDTVNLNRVRIGSKPITFILEIKGDFPRLLKGDELRIRQVLNNILSNAIKYTNEGSVKLEVKNEELSNPSLITFSVSDTGIGIRPEDMQNLFSEYTQFDKKSNRKIEGTGLGLSITKKLVEMMGGTINVESEYGKGSCFTVNLVQEIPYTGTDYSLSQCIGDETAEMLKSFQYTKADKKEDIKRFLMPYGRVLIVDDLPVNLQVARGLLEPYGLAIDTAESGQRAIDLIKSGIKYDIVFMDHMMPEMDGIETTSLIREWEENAMSFAEGETQRYLRKQVPIIALTANAMAGNMEMFLSKGFNGFISKPIDILQLDEVLNKWVRKKENEEVKQMVKNNEQPESTLIIQGLDTQHGIAMTGGNEEAYLSILSTFSKDGQDRLSLLQTQPSLESLTSFITQVHALKSASSSIGAAKLSAMAGELESAGFAKDMGLIQDKLPAFAEQLANLVNNIRAALKKKEDEKPPSRNNSQFSIPHSLFNDLAAALDSEKANDINQILKEINAISRQQDFDPIIREALEQISDEVMMVEYDSAKKILMELLEKQGG